MYDEKSLIINLNGVGQSPLPFDFVLANNYFQAQTMSDKLQGGRVEVAGSIVRVGRMYQVQWQATGNVVVPCDLCLDEVEVPMEVSAQYQVDFGQEPDETEDTIVLADGETTLDLGWYVCESLVLGLPITTKHEDGACNADMAATLGEYLARENSPAEEEEWN